MNDLATPHLPRQDGPAGALPMPLEIPRARYLNEEFHRAEIEHVFRKSWLQVGHVSEYEREGSYRLVDIPFAPVIVVRGKDGMLRAFLNSCQHRGAAVVRDQHGCARVLSCPYHGWTYSLSGQLIGVTDEKSFPALDLHGRSLVSLRCELWCGFVFVNFDQNAPALLDRLAPIVSRYSAIVDTPLRIVSKQSWEVGCNWKIAVEAFRESYHLNLIHRQSVGLVLDGDLSKNVMYRNGHFSMQVPNRPRLQQATEWNANTQHSTLRALPGMETSEFSEGFVIGGVFPNFHMSFQRPGFPLARFWPLAIDRSRMDFTWYGADWGDGPRPAEWESILAAFEVIVNEDIGNLASIQKSLEADPGKSVPLSTQEWLLYQMHAEIDKLIGAENMPDGLFMPDVLEDHLVS